MKCSARHLRPRCRCARAAWRSFGACCVFSGGRAEEKDGVCRRPRAGHRPCSLSFTPANRGRGLTGTPREPSLDPLVCFPGVCGSPGLRDWRGTGDCVSYNEGEKRKAAQTSSRDAGGFTGASPRLPGRPEQRDAGPGQRQGTGPGKRSQRRRLRLWLRGGGRGNLRSRELSFVPGPQESWRR